MTIFVLSEAVLAQTQPVIPRRSLPPAIQRVQPNPPVQRQPQTRLATNSQTIETPNKTPQHELTLGGSVIYGASHDRIVSTSFYELLGLGIPLNYQYTHNSVFRHLLNVSFEGGVLINENAEKQTQFYSRYTPSWYAHIFIDYIFAPHLVRTDFFSTSLGLGVKHSALFNYYDWSMARDSANWTLSGFGSFDVYLDFIFYIQNSPLEKLSLVLEAPLIGYAVRPDWSNYTFNFSLSSWHNFISVSVALNFLFSVGSKRNQNIYWGNKWHYLYTNLPNRTFYKSYTRLAYTMTIGATLHFD